MTFIKKPKVLIVSGIVILLLAGGVYAGSHFLWWFSAGYSPRQTTQAFFSDVTNGNQSAAYQLTSSVFQANNSSTTFNSQFQPLYKNDLVISYASYTKNIGWTSVVGIVNDKTTNKQYNFGFQVSNNTNPVKIGTINIIPLTQS